MQHCLASFIALALAAPAVAGPKKIPVVVDTDVGPKLRDYLSRA